MAPHLLPQIEAWDAEQIDLDRKDREAIANFTTRKLAGGLYVDYIVRELRLHGIGPAMIETTLAKYGLANSTRPAPLDDAHQTFDIVSNAGATRPSQ